MKEIIYKINHAISKKLVNKYTTVEDWYKGKIKKSRGVYMNLSNSWSKENKENFLVEKEKLKFINQAIYEFNTAQMIQKEINKALGLTMNPYQPIDRQNASEEGCDNDQE